MSLKKLVKYYGKPYKANPILLKRAIKIEKEHTNNIKLAKAIVYAHVKEMGWKYYDNKVGLPALERRLAKLRKK